VAQKETDHLTTIINRSSFTVLFFGLVLLLPQTWPNTLPTSANILQAVCISAVSTLGLVCYVYSLRFTPVSLAVPISSLNTFFGILTALLILNEPFHYSLLIALALIFIALRLLQKKNSLTLSTGVWLNIGAAFFWGVTFALFRLPISHLGPWLFGAILEAVVLLTALLLFLFQKKTWTWQPLLQNWRWFVLLGTLGFGGVLFFNLSTQHLPITLLSLLSVSTIFLSLLLARLWLKETVQKREWYSIALFALAVCVLKALY
jgi:drug/metabolite transporter (DMT)-like permease